MKWAVRVASRVAFALAVGCGSASVVLVYVSLLTVRVCEPGGEPCLNGGAGAIPVLLVAATMSFGLGILLGGLGAAMEGDHEHRSDR